MSNNRLDISVILPVYNGSKYLRECLGAINNSDYAPREIIVVDDCSTDNSIVISREMGASVISTPRQSGPAAARNLGAAIARSKVFLFLDADVVVKPDTIRKVAERFERNPEISALFGSYDDEPGEENFLSQYRNLLHHYVHQTSNSEASTFWTGLGAIRGEVFHTAGGFDYKQFPAPSIEDIEIGVRLRSAGCRIYLDRDIQGKHLKKWGAWSILHTDIFRRALPWSKLLLTGRRKIINDLNLKTTDRFSAVFVFFSIAVVPLAVLRPQMFYLFGLFLIGIIVLNRKLLVFFFKKKGFFFALFTLPWLWLYFLYSALTFLICWLWYAFPLLLRGIKKSQN